MFVYVVSNAMPFIVFFFLKRGNKQDSWIFGGRAQKRGAIFKGRGGDHLSMKLWYRGNKFLLKTFFHLTHKENIEETKEVSRKPRKLSLPL